jgi:hypothetical protein
VYVMRFEACALIRVKPVIGVHVRRLCGPHLSESQSRMAATATRLTFAHGHHDLTIVHFDDM